MCKSIAEPQASLNSMIRGVLSCGTLAAAATAACLLLTACQQDGPLDGSGASTVDADAKVMEVMVEPELRECVGVAPRKCLEVNGELSYELPGMAIA